MGWVVDASCSDCGYARTGLRFGATHAEIGQHDVCHRALVLASCCGTVQDVVLYMGQRPPPTPCDSCEATLDLDAVHRYRIATLKGEVLSNHPCPRCAAPSLAFERTDEFV